MSAVADSLLSVSIAERDTNGDAMVVWSYPSTDQDLDTSVVKRSGVLLDKPEQQGDVWYRRQNSWIYTHTMAAGNKERLPQTVALSVALQAKDFDPEKYLKLASMLGEVYEATGNPVRVLEGYLSILTVGTFVGRTTPPYDVAAFDSLKATREAPVSDITRALGAEVATVWAAVVLKKRVLVYSDQLSSLLQVMRALPALAWHRQDWTILRPLCTDDDDLAELSGLGVYCAGTTVPSLERAELYDIYVDLPGGSVTVAKAARGDMAVNSVHKDVATFLVSAEEEGLPAGEVIEGLGAKTRQLVEKLGLLAEQEDGGKISLASLKEQLPSAALAQFLFGAALAEGLASGGVGLAMEAAEEAAEE